MGGEDRQRDGHMLPLKQWPADAALAVKGIKDGHVQLRDGLAALRTVLEQTGKLKGVGDSLSALAEAIQSDRERSAKVLASGDEDAKHYRELIPYIGDGK